MIIACISAVYAGVFTEEAAAEASAQTSASDELSLWTHDIGIGICTPIKWVTVDNKTSFGTAIQLHMFYRGEYKNGFSLYMDGAVGPFGSNDLKVGDSSGIYWNTSFTGGPGYNVLHGRYDNQSLVISGIAGIDVIAYDSNKITTAVTYEKECFLLNFGLGLDVFYRIAVHNKISLYAGCSGLAGIGWLTCRVTEQETVYPYHTKPVYTEYDSSRLISTQARIGVMYRL